ncbi:hypothetical protein [Oribacterium sp. oral taxon 078]|uniref:defense against restriction DarA-related protein n=1 Tax=Oribacterium sp. oral taxon 078 TaxID=652706 RepID=UPI000419C984|nr:hypothetical protein [Oribacterium sp. oral taxon 078]
MKLYKYYLLRRPPAPGALPTKGLFRIKDFNGCKLCKRIMNEAWGLALYTRPLEPEEIRQYELAYGGKVEEAR